MDKETKVELIKKTIIKFHKNVEFDIIRCEMVPRYKYLNEEWVPDTDSFFVDIKLKKYEDKEKINSNRMEDFFGLEFTFNFV